MKRTELAPPALARAVRLYTEEQLSLSAIARRFGVSDYIIRRALREAGVTLRPVGDYKGPRRPP